MVKRQTVHGFLFAIFWMAMLNASIPAQADPLKESLMIADSLFEEKRFTQSFDIYQDILQTTGKTSPAMLLKMAFIREGLGDHTDALYYLNLYYLKTFNLRVLKKMENLAETYQLEGYNYDDTEVFLNLYHRYRFTILAGIAAITLFLFATIAYKRRTSRARPVFAGSAYLVLLLLLFLLNNFGREKPKAIITSNQAYLMAGPSPGAKLVEVTGRGHRVEVLGREDVWVRIHWKDQIAYIKDHDLRPVRL